ncbi:MAG: DUF3611 family protein [Minisyncoccota bacterium]
MNDSRLLAYIRERIAAGAGRDQISQELLANGWLVETINNAFAEFPTPSENTLSVPIANEVSTENSPNDISVTKRIVSAIGYIIVFYISSNVVFGTATAVLTIRSLMAVFSAADLSLTQLPTSAQWGVGVASIVSLCFGIFWAWATGRYFNWAVFRRSPRPHREHRVFGKIIFFVINILLLILFVLGMIPTILGFFYPDRAPINDSDLSLPIVSIPQDQNAYFSLQNVAAQENVLDSSTSTEEEKAKAATTIFTAIATAAQKPSYQDPAAADPAQVTIATILPPLNAYRQALRFNDSYAQHLAQSGASDQALAEASLGVSIGKKMQDSQSFLIEQLVALAVKDEALGVIANIATSTAKNSKSLIAEAATIGSYQSDGSGLIKAFKLDHASRKSALDALNGIKTTLYWHPNDSFGYEADDTRQRVAMAQSRCSVFKEGVSQRSSEQLAPSNRLLWYFTPNIVGKLMHDVVWANLDTAKIKQCNDSVMLVPPN